MHDAVGSKWTLTAFRRFLRENNIDDDALWTRIESCVARSLVSVEGVCAPAMQVCFVLFLFCVMFNFFKKNKDWAHHRTSCFELFGFDVLIDDNLQPWVLEVNLRLNDE